METYRFVIAQRDGEVAVPGFVVQEVVLDHLAAITRTEHEFGQAVMGKEFHNVPEDGAAADFDHRLRSVFGFFTEAGAEPTAKDHDLRRHCVRVAAACCVSARCEHVRPVPGHES